MVPTELVNESLPKKESVPMVAETKTFPEFLEAVLPVMATLLMSDGNAENAYATETTFVRVFPICKPEVEV